MNASIDNLKSLFITLGFSLKEGVADIFYKKYPRQHDYVIEINCQRQCIDYGEEIKTENKVTQNFSQAENWVVLECVNRLLEKGYEPKNIILEKTWPSGHGTSGRIDICVTHNDGSEYLLIECKTWGREFEKEFEKIKKDGGQLFTYFKFSNKADIIILYTSELNKKNIVYQNKIIKIEEDYRNGGVKDFYDKWNKLTKDNGVFDTWVTPYEFASKALTPTLLNPIREEDSSFIFNRFLEILRHNVVSDKPNAFNKIFTLFLCKIYDEKTTHENKELQFQWKEGHDDDIKFQIRLTDLYKNGMHEFLGKTVTDFSTSDFETKYKDLDATTKNNLQRDIEKLRLEKNNEFAIKEVFDEKSFQENAKVVRQVVELLQSFKIRYTKKQQYLSDFFELLLTTGLKQESGQFFTPVPITQFIIKSMPINDVINQKLANGKKDDLLPYVIDYAAGSGHFLTEIMHEIQRILADKDPSQFIRDTSNKIQNWQKDHFDWALQYVYGIEKDYRLVKVGKVGCYLHGDGLANVVHSDGLGNFTQTEEYKDKLSIIADKDFPKENKQFDMVVSNPPYSVQAFKQNARNYYTEKDFELYCQLTDTSSEIECLFIERTSQLLKDGGMAGIILPSSILSNTGIYTKARALLLKNFDIIAIAELGKNTFMATGTNTVTLFLRRRNNYDCINVKKSVERYFTDLQDVTSNGIENPIQKYIAHAWKTISMDDYKTLLEKKPNNAIQEHELYQEYKKKIKAKNKTEKWDVILNSESEKVLFFILAFPQRVVLINSGEKTAEKQFLGYEFSNRRGSEGIHPIQRGKSIDECTSLFDPENFDNPKKASTYVHKAFKGDFDFPIDESLEKNIRRENLVDMLTFDRVDFEKTISLSAKKKIKIESKWELKRLGDVAKIEKGTSITKAQTKSGAIKVVAAGVYFAYYHNEANRQANTITISASGANAGALNFWKEPIFASDCITVLGKNTLFTSYIFYILKLLQSQIFDLARGQAQPHVYASDVANIKIPLPPIDIQEKIVSEIEKYEKQEQKAVEGIRLQKEKIHSLMSNLFNSATKTIRLSDTDIFDIRIGKRVLKSEIKNQGAYPVYSANVFQPFGHVDKVLLKDFTSPSVVWGIDGDWMVNVISTDIPFYPTDHCGYLRIKKPIVKAKYLAFCLKKEGQKIGFSRTKRASIDRIQGIRIPLPSFEEQQKIVSEIEKIEIQIIQLEKEIKIIPQKKETILKKYLE